MAKEQVHNWLRTMVLIVTIGIAGGGYAMKINGNSDAIVEVKKDNNKAHAVFAQKIERTVDNIHRVELNAKDVKALAASAAEAMNSIENKFTTIQTQLNVQATVQAVNSEKLKTLTKD